MSKVDDKKVQELREFIHKEIPDFQVVYKDEPGWHKTNFSTFVTWLFFQIIGIFSSSLKDRFYHNYANGLHGNTMVFPTRNERYTDWSRGATYRLVRHELVHLLDQRKSPIWFAISYALILPTVFTMRAHWELRGYTATMLAYHEQHGHIPEWLIDSIARKFTSTMYFWMYPFPEKIKDRLFDIRMDIYMGKTKGFYF